MNSPPTPPYCGSVAAALHLMNSQIRCGSCRKRFISVYRLAMDATRQGDFQKAAILFKALNRNKPLNGSAMNSPPTPPYCGSVTAALHLMNSQIRCGSCREKFFSVYRLAMDATRQGDDVAGWKSGACSGISSRHSIKGSSEPFASSARFFSGFCLSFIRSNSEQFVFPKQEFFSINAH